MPIREPLSYRDDLLDRNPGAKPVIDRRLANPNAPKQIQRLGDATYDQPTPGVTAPRMRSAAEMVAQRQARVGQMLNPTQMANDRFETQQAMRLGEANLRSARQAFYKNPKDPQARQAMAVAQNEFERARRSFMENDRLSRPTVADQSPEQFAAGRASLQAQADAIRAGMPAQQAAAERDIYSRAASDKLNFGYKIEPQTQAYYGTGGLPQGAGVRADVARGLSERDPYQLAEMTGGRVQIPGGQSYAAQRDAQAGREIADAQSIYAIPKGDGKIKFQGDYNSLAKSARGADYQVAMDNTRKRVGERELAESRMKELDSATFKAGVDAIGQPARELKMKEAAAQQGLLESAAKIAKLEAETRAAIAGLPSPEFKAGSEKLQLRKMELENKFIEKQIRDFGLEGLSTAAVSQVGNNWLNDVKNIITGYDDDRAAASQNLDAAVSEIEAMAASEPEKAKVFAGSIIRRMKSMSPPNATLSQSILAGAGIVMGQTSYLDATRADRAVQAAKVDAYLERLKAIAGESK